MTSPNFFVTSPKKIGRSQKINKLLPTKLGEVKKTHILLPKKLGEVCKKHFSALSVIGKKMTSPN